LYSKDNITLGEERGNTFIMLFKEERKGDCGNAINSEYFENSGGSYTGRPSESESLRKKMIGKPYSGKPNVRFDEGELEIEPLATTPALYSTEVLNMATCQFLFHCKSKMILRRLGGGDEAYYIYVEEADDRAFAGQAQPTK
jgi:hypothetical protein